MAKWMFMHYDGDARCEIAESVAACAGDASHLFDEVRDGRATARCGVVVDAPLLFPQLDAHAERHPKCTTCARDP